jgi:O-antigen/teichoic acid export membrane protein
MSLRKNTLWNLVGLGAPLIVAAFSIPFLLKTIGQEAFGVLTLLWAIIGYFSLFDLGLGRALTQVVSASRGVEPEHKIKATIQSGLGLILVTGVAGAILLAVFSGNLAYGWLNVSHALQEQTWQALLISACGIPMTTLSIGYRGVLEAYNDFKISNLYRVLLGVLNFLIPVIVVCYFSNSLVLISLGLVASRLLVLFLHYSYLRRRYDIRFDKGLLNFTASVSLIKYGSWTTVSNVIGPIMVSADRFFISSVLGASVVAFYTVPYEVVVRLLILPVALTSALFPALAQQLANGSDNVSKIYRDSFLAVVCLMIPICAIAGLGFETFLNHWINEEFSAAAWKVGAILCVGILFNSLGSLPFTYLQAAGKSRLTALIHSAEALVYVPLLLALLHFFGVVGAAVAWSARTAVDYMILEYFRAKLVAENRMQESLVVSCGSQ